ncbi:hypothetical protein BHM03_00058130 [Ensete ventricosum]|uniref:Uncharacterized protein n=1 Tax=Ensete ventricosum TaxID=4639 RepID=A0A426YTB8_ENSVE|nr:hypothetical protein B296_00022719 [Ensete ventricosum]RZS24983.1 hypothetical protein BHM03_00058130 [Ensete ventricosum]
MSGANMMFDFFAMEKTRSCARGQLSSPLSSSLPFRLIYTIDGLMALSSDRLHPAASVEPDVPLAAVASGFLTIPLFLYPLPKETMVYVWNTTQAEAVMKLAERTVDYRLLAQLNEELLPIPRKKSLQRFLEKRQQR